MPDPAQVQILIDIKARLDELAKAQAGMRAAREEAESFGHVLAQGFGLGTGMELARRGIEMLKASIEGAIDSAFLLAKEIKQNASDIGFTGEQYQVFKNELHESGLDMSRLTMAVGHQTESLAAARTGAGAAAAAYRELGLSASAVEALPTAERLLVVARATLNATDQTKAFSAAGQILGVRGLPSLLGALKSLSTDGYGKLSEEMKNANRIMSDDNAAALRNAEKQIEKLKQQLTIVSGEFVGVGLAVKNSFSKDTFGTLMAFLNASPFFPSTIANLFSKIASNQPPAKTEPTVPTGGDNGAAALQEQLHLRTEIAMSQEEQKTAEEKIFIDESERDRQRAVRMREQFDLRQKLVKSLEENPVAALGKDAQDLELKKLREENIRLNEQIAGLDQSASGKISAAYRNATDKNGPNYIKPGQGLMAGYQQWVTQVGSLGQQIAATFQSTLGTTVQNISQGIYGLITGTQTWGQTLRSIGVGVLQTVLQSLIQIGVQQFVIATVGRALQMSSAAASLATNAALAAALSAVMIVPATLATIMSFGGAAAAAPGEIAASLVASAGLGLFSDGGFTGAGGKYEPAGVVHRGEYVMDADTVSRVGVGRLDAMRFSGGASLSGGGSGGGGRSGGAAPMAGRQERLLVYVDSQETLNRLGRDPRFENKVVDIGKRRRGEIFSV